MMPWRSVLFVSAHADDALMGAGGVAAMLQDTDTATCHVVFTLSEKDNGIGFTAEELRQELRAANDYLGFTLQHTFKFPVHFLPENGARIRRELEQLRVDLHPDLVLIPSLTDTHQDHVAVAREALRVYRNQETVLCYELLRNSVHPFHPTVYVDVSAVMERKLMALACFKTQVARPYMHLANFTALATVRGTQIGVAAAEAFEAVKVVF